MNLMTVMSQRQSEVTLKIKEEIKNIIAYVCSTKRYYQSCEDYSFVQHEWPQPMPSGYTHFLRGEGPPFEPWVVSYEPIGMYHPIIHEPDDSLYADKDFIWDILDE